ncbi:unnamed protein product [Amoebophrya sp. A25]|nr:unnamed protein product [Amoebophrya sp. A25]|eukprot:GSA25T00022551001.1
MFGEGSLGSSARRPSHSSSKFDTPPSSPIHPAVVLKSGSNTDDELRSIHSLDGTGSNSDESLLHHVESAFYGTPASSFARLQHLAGAPGTAEVSSNASSSLGGNAGTSIDVSGGAGAPQSSGGDLSQQPALPRLRPQAGARDVFTETFVGGEPSRPGDDNTPHFVGATPSSSSRSYFGSVFFRGTAKSRHGFLDISQLYGMQFGVPDRDEVRDHAHNGMSMLLDQGQAALKMARYLVDPRPNEPALIFVDFADHSENQRDRPEDSSFMVEPLRWARGVGRTISRSYRSVRSAVEDRVVRYTGAQGNPDAAGIRDENKNEDVLRTAGIKNTMVGILDVAFSKWRRMRIESKRSALVAAFLVSLTFRQRKMAAGCACAYLFSTVPPSESFEANFKIWFHKNYFPKIVFRLHDLWRERREAQTSTGLAVLQKALLRAEEKPPTVGAVYEIVRGYPNDFVDCVFCKVATKESGPFKLVFAGAMNKWAAVSSSADLTSEEILEKLVTDIKVTPTSTHISLLVSSIFFHLWVFKAKTSRDLENVRKAKIIKWGGMICHSNDLVVKQGA